MKEVTRHEIVIPEDLQSRLHHWFSHKVRHAQDLDITSIQRPAANGYSALTYVVEVQWRKTGEKSGNTFVIRQEAPGETRLIENDFVPPIRAQQRLGDLPGLCVPGIHWIETDTNILGTRFCAMEYVSGRIAADNPPFTESGWVFDATVLERRQMILSAMRFLQKLHAVDWKGLGLDFLDKTPSGAALQLEPYLLEYRDLLIRSCNGVMPDIGRRTLNWLVQNKPSTERLSVVWGDARLGNMIFEEFELAAAIDWEMVMLGDPTQDIAYFSFLNRICTDGYGLERMEGLPIGDDAVAAYQSAGNISARDFRFYEVFAGFRSLAIFARYLRLLTDQGVNLAGMTPQNNPSAMLVGQLIREG